MRHVFTLLTISTLQFQTLLAAPFVKGHYYTSDGKKVEGLIKFGRATFSAFGSKPCNIKFKANSNSAPIKLTAEDISAFVIGTDSFAIVQNIKINSINGEYARDFAQVVEIGHLNLFVHKSASSDGQFSYDHDKFVISRDNKVFYGIWNFNKQRNEIAEYFSERPDLKEKILNKKDETPFQTLVKEFNKGAGLN